MAVPMPHFATPDADAPRRKPGARKPGRRLLTGVCAGLCACAAGGSSLLLAPAGASQDTPALPTGTGLVLNAPIVDVAATPGGHGYWEVGSDGGVFSFGNARFFGSTGSLALNRPIVGMQATPDAKGYWEVASDGGVFALGDAGFYGSTGSLDLTSPVVGLDPTPDGKGYWEVASDGGIFSFGDAGFFGSAVGMSDNSPIVGLASTSDGKGYWEVSASGSVFAFGNAAFAGNAPAGTSVVGINADHHGYRLVSSGGGVFAYHGAAFYGSTGGLHLNQPVIGTASTPGGYLSVAADGGIFAFGRAGYFGSLGGSTVRQAPAAAAAQANYGLTTYQIGLWDHVNMCEEGGVWDVDGPRFAGGLGFTRANWAAFNTFGFPSDAADASPLQQIRVAVAFAEAYWGSPNAAPDEHGCAGY